MRKYVTEIAGRSARLRRAVVEAPMEIRRFTAGAYPRFVLERRPKPLMDRVPAFVLHTVDEVRLSRQLEFLRANGYQTLTLEQFMAFLAGALRLSGPSVLLTLDDGDRSWYDVAYPLLKRYGFTAVGFVVPRCVREEPGERGARGWLSWSEIQEIEDSGVIDFQSHGHFHDKIFVGPELTGFYHPRYPVDTLGLSVPWTKRNGSYTNDLQYGTPLYRMAPSMLGHLRYLEDERLREECVDWVQSQGSERFFERPDWRQGLTRFYESRARGDVGVRYETPDEQRERLLAALVESKRMLEERLGKRVDHFCYPWGAGSEMVVSLSKEAGYRSNFWTSLPGRSDNASGDSPYYITRLKDDYITRLPGEGRSPLYRLFAEKAIRRVRKADIY